MQLFNLLDPSALHRGMAGHEAGSYFYRYQTAVELVRHSSASLRATFVQLHPGRAGAVPLLDILQPRGSSWTVSFGGSVLKRGCVI